MKLAVIRLKGPVKMKKFVNDTFEMLRLYNKNFCVVLEDTPATKGMINKVKDFVTFGEIKDEIFNDLVSKRGEEYKDRIADSKGKINYSRKFFEFNGKKYKKYFRLGPPIGGFGRKGIKTAFVKSGASGYRGEKINDLLKRMI
jgi:large subunit ribosomal protein L30